MSIHYDDTPALSTPSLCALPPDNTPSQAQIARLVELEAEVFMDDDDEATPLLDAFEEHRRDEHGEEVFGRPWEGEGRRVVYWGRLGPWEYEESKYDPEREDDRGWEDCGCESVW